MDTCRQSREATINITKRNACNNTLGSNLQTQPHSAHTIRLKATRCQAARTRAAPLRRKQRDNRHMNIATHQELAMYAHTCTHRRTHTRALYTAIANYMESELVATDGELRERRNHLINFGQTLVPQSPVWMLKLQL